MLIAPLNLVMIEFLLNFEGNAMPAMTGEERLIENFPFEIRESEVLRYLGQKKNSLPLGETLKQDLATEIERGKALAQPSVLFLVEHLTGAGEGEGPVKIRQFPLQSKNLARLFEGCEYGLVALLTIGASLENRVAELFKSGAYAKALMLDAAGSEAVESAADAFLADVSGVLKKTLGPFRFTRRVSPGYGDWNLQEQRVIFSLLSGRRVNIELTDSCLMKPRKSISFIAGIRLGGDPPDHDPGEKANCEVCDLDACKSRIESDTTEEVHHDR